MNSPSYSVRAARERTAAQIFQRKAEACEQAGIETAAKIYRSLQSSSWKAAGDLETLAAIFGD